MNRDRIEGIHRQLRGKLIGWWGVLTRNGDAVVAGAEEHLVGRIQEQRGISKQAADRQIEDFMNRNRNWSDISKR